MAVDEKYVYKIQENNVSLCLKHVSESFFPGDPFSTATFLATLRSCYIWSEEIMSKPIQLACSVSAAICPTQLALLDLITQIIPEEYKLCNSITWNCLRTPFTSSLLRVPSVLSDTCTFSWSGRKYHTHIKYF
jgi:hypothetical protein